MRTIWVTHRFVGFHNWPGAPVGRQYLSRRHRHLFHVRVEVNVEHDDREVEFHDLRDKLAEACDDLGTAALGAGRDLKHLSCEQIANSLTSALSMEWPGRWWAVDVSEDGEVGAHVETDFRDGVA